MLYAICVTIIMFRAANCVHYMLNNWVVVLEKILFSSVMEMNDWSALDQPTTSSLISGFNPSAPDQPTTSSQPSGFDPSAPDQPTTSSQPSNFDPSATDELSTPSKRNRKRKCNKAAWKKNIRKEQYNTGMTVKRRKDNAGGIIPLQQSRGVRGTCTAVCPRKCSTKVCQEQQAIINREFWRIGDSKRRRDFVSSYTTVMNKKDSKGDVTRRQKSIYYFLPDHAGHRAAVCKSFFLNTLDISSGVVRKSHESVVVAGITPTREKKKAHNKTSQASVNDVKRHIKSFPVMPSHYSRAKTKRQYLEAGLSVRKMYRLYKTSCVEKQKKAVSEFVYRDVFNSKFNIGFHQPSKDRCPTCDKFEKLVKSGVQISAEKQVVFDSHLRRKEQARASKLTDKNDHDDSSAVFTMDLQEVINLPKLSVGPAYYLRKLHLYNFTMYNVKSREATNFMWNESEAGRGANEISSALWRKLQEEDEKGCIKRVVLYSDTCAGQNRNKTTSTMLACFLKQSKHITVIEQKYFESGHSQMECDSVHSTIEHAVKKLDIFLPSQYMAHVIHARTDGEPYRVETMTTSDICDWTAINSSFFKANAFNGVITKHHIVYKKDDSETVEIAFSDEIDGPQEKIKYRRPGGQITDVGNLVITSAIKKPTIDKNKKADLKKLCEFLPSDSRHFYEQLL